jgi:hypothetical protein
MVSIDPILGSGFETSSNIQMRRCEFHQNARILTGMLRFFINSRLEAYINLLKLDMSSRYAGPLDVI